MVNVSSMIKSNNGKRLKKLVNSIRISLQPTNQDNSPNAQKTINALYTGFTYLAGELSAFTCSLDTFLILLNDGGVIRHQPDNPPRFRKWLIENNIRDLEESETM